MDTKNINSLITVIVPVYNGAKYLPKLIKNLSEQTYKHLEILMLDDFSTDESVKLIEEAVAKDKRFQLIKLPRKGGNAVTGQEYATQFVHGEYYFYMSQDDFIDEDLFEKCIKRALETNADIVMPNMVLYYENQPIKKALDYPLNRDYESELAPQKAFELSLTWHVHGFVLRKTSLFKKVGFDSKYYNSDEFYGRKAMLEANKIVFADTNFYYRQDNPDALTKTIKYFSIDVMTTDLMLVDLAIKNNCNRQIIRGRIRSLRGTFTWWAKRIYSPQWDKNQRKYIKSACRSAFKKLFVLSLRYGAFNKTVPFLLRGIKCI